MEQNNDRGTRAEHMEEMTTENVVKTLKKLREYIMLKPTEVAALTFAINVMEGSGEQK